MIKDANRVADPSTLRRLSLQSINPTTKSAEYLRRVHRLIGTGIRARLGLVRTTGTPA